MKAASLAPSIFRVATFALVGSFFMWSFPIRAARDEKMTVQQFIENRVAALGGSDRIQRTVSRVARGKAELIPGPKSGLTAMTGTAMIYSKSPHKVALSINFPSRTMGRGFDGVRPWIRPTPSPSEMSVAKALNKLMCCGYLLRDASLYDGFLTPQKDVELKYKGTRKIDGRETHQIEIKSSEANARAFFDAATFLHVKTTMSILFNPDEGNNSGGRIPGGNSGGLLGAGTGGFGGGGTTVSVANIEFETGDFRDVNGVKLPFSYIERMPAYTIKITIEGYEENVPIPDTVFQ